jgi:hypothetical protein
MDSNKTIVVDRVSSLKRMHPEYSSTTITLRRPYRRVKMEVEIGGVKCLFDDEDWAWVGLFSLTVRKVNNDNLYVYFKKYAIHRMIYELHNGTVKSGNVVDHANRISTDNRLINLRQIPNYQNLHWNRRKRKGTSRYIGVSKDKPSGKWRSQHTFNGENTYLGLYDSEYDAAVEHDLYALYHYRNPLRLNFPSMAENIKLLIGKK